MIQTVYVEKRAGFCLEAEQLQADSAAFLGVQVQKIRILNRYTVDRLSAEDFALVRDTVFSEPQTDLVFETVPAQADDTVFALEYLPGQYDQRADSAAQCIELITGVKAPVRTARVYILHHETPLSAVDCKRLKQYLINPVDSRETTPEPPQSCVEAAAAPPDTVAVVAGFTAAIDLETLARRYGLALSIFDIMICQLYFSIFKREPTITELLVLDTYWSDHCRHTTFMTYLNAIDASDASDDLVKALELYEKTRQEVYEDTAPLPSLMDIACIGAKALKKRGLLADWDESAEINACTVKITAEFADGSSEPWLLLFKNETHNHPTEIEPSGGAATCLGGAIRDPLSGRAFVHQAMRISGSGDPRQPVSETLPGKLPQIKIARESAAGYASYGNQIGLATGQVAEFYHAGFIAKHLELGAVIAAVPYDWVQRAEPAAGDKVVLVGGKTGRDGIGGATGSSKVQTGESLYESGAEVQKGNAVEERKLQRFMRNPAVVSRIKRCNDCGAGGVSVAVGEIAAGLDLDLNAIPKKYESLDGTALALSESQERMAVVIAAADVQTFIEAAARENLDATVIAEVSAEAGMRFYWQGKKIVDLSRNLLNSNGARRQTRVRLPSPARKRHSSESLEQALSSLHSASRRGLQERFDGSIGAGSVLFPFGGTTAGTPECGMASLIPSLDKEALTASIMTFGFDPETLCADPYEGTKASIREALVKFACLGGDPFTARLSLQEYFPRPQSPETWGIPVAALLGALEAQLALGVPAIGGKDSMSGTYHDQAHGISLEVPPTVVAFAAGVAPAARILSGALSGTAGNSVLLFPYAGTWEGFKRSLLFFGELKKAEIVCAAYPVGAGGVAASLAVMAFGSMIGLDFDADAVPQQLAHQGSFLVELKGDGAAARWREAGALCIARTTSEPIFRTAQVSTPLARLRDIYEAPLAGVYQVEPERTPRSDLCSQSDPCSPQSEPEPALRSDLCSSSDPCSPSGVKHTERAFLHVKRALGSPTVLIPVFPGTNCEWDTERAFRRAGARTEIVVFRNRNHSDIVQSIRELAQAVAQAQILALCGGFSAGDEPDGSGKFIAAVFRSRFLIDALQDLLNHDGLVLGICNGFQALIKTGLVPYGTIKAAREDSPTLTVNRIGRHVSRMVRTRVVSRLSPWMRFEEPEAVHIVPVSHGQGRLVMQQEEARRLFEAGQVPFCYIDNPNGSDYDIEALCSPDGRILGKMAHSERVGRYIHRNVPGNKVQRLFEAGVQYFM
ncbi:MAG: phosphoribosylformylglycinamidine synthase [Spirochaetaceae bacterium]|jgi:phosphoribosylformylglycinamidine synthase|nr:phosphoribosylformylglycinamidine synthase [Spirochaetaceae bacterium]